MALHQALTAFDGRKQEMVNGEVAKLKDATHLMNELLSSMNLPAAIEETSGTLIPFHFIHCTQESKKSKSILLGPSKLMSLYLRVG